MAFGRSVAREDRTYSLSAAFCNLGRNARDDLTRGYEDFCVHYGMPPSRNNRGIDHENGAIKSTHGHLKRTHRRCAAVARHCRLR
ncbi:hypothetical protein ABIC07_008357 [Bradyrhizobium sp. RT9a]